MLFDNMLDNVCSEFNSTVSRRVKSFIHLSVCVAGFIAAIVCHQMEYFKMQPKTILPL